MANGTLKTAQQRKKRVTCKETLRKESSYVETLRILIDNRSSYKERTADALAPRAEEGRGKHRNATGSRKQTSIRGCPNGGTYHL